MPVEGRKLHNNGLSEDISTVLKNEGTELERIAEISVHLPRPEFTSLYHHINKELWLQCHKELDGSKPVGIDEITKKEYERNLEQNIGGLVDRLKRKSYKPQPSLRVYIPKNNGKLRPLGFTFYYGRTQKSYPWIMPKTNSKNFRQKLKNMKIWLYANRDQPLCKLMGMINLKLVGDYRYYGVSFSTVE